jgi:hypothetical protein
LISAEQDDGNTTRDDVEELCDTDRWSTGEELANDSDQYVLDTPQKQNHWEFDGIGIVDQEGETCHSVENTGVGYVEIAGLEYLDPPKKLPPNRPTPASDNTNISEYN